MRSLLAIVLLCYSLAFFVVPVQSYAVQDGFTLQDALNRTLASNPTIQSAIMAAEAADDRAKQLRGALLPEARVQGSWAIKRQDELGRSRTRHPHTEQVVVSQPLTMGQEYADWQAAKAEGEAQLAKAQGIVQRVLLDTATAYCDVLVGRDTLQGFRKLVENLSYQQRGTKRQYEEGEGTKTGMATVGARLANARGNLARAKAQLEASEAQLESLLASEVVPHSMDWPASPKVTLKREKAVVADHPSVAEAEARVSIQKYRTKAAAAEIFPEVNLAVSTGRDAGDQFSNDAWANRVTLNYSIPLFRGGRTVYGIKAAQMEQQAAAQALQSAIYDVRTEWLSASSAWEATDRALKESTVAEQEQQTAIYGARIEYENGERSLTELLNAEQEFIDAAVSLSRARREHIVSAYRLKAAQGDLVPLR